jgi:predicted permease
MSLQLSDALIVAASMAILTMAFLSVLRHLIIYIAVPLTYLKRHVTAGLNGSFHGAAVVSYRAIVLPFRIIWYILRLPWTIIRLYRFS